MPIKRAGAARTGQTGKPNTISGKPRELLVFLKGEVMKKALMAGAALSLMMTGSAWADITIAVAGPMTGQYASFGEQMKAGAEQAIADINEAGGVNGEMLKLEVGDDACDPKQAVAVANQFAGSGVVFVSASQSSIGV